MIDEVEVEVEVEDEDEDEVENENENDFYLPRQIFFQVMTKKKNS